MKLHEQFVEMLVEEFGSNLATEIIAGYALKEPVRGLKINNIKAKALPFKTSPSKLNNDILIPDNYKQAVVHPFHHGGCYYIQDPSATLPVKALTLNETDIVLDICGAPGGKSTQILNEIPKGFLVTNEVDVKRASKLVGNIERWGLEQVVVVNEDGRNLPKYFENMFDKIVLDAPCSGEGLYRKHPDHAASYNMKTILELKALQLELLESAYLCVHDNGDIVYSTCTLNPYENEDVVIAFLNNHPECELIPHNLNNAQNGLRGLNDKVARFYPSADGEGHFIAKIRVHKEGARKQLQFKQYLPQTININQISFTGHIINKKGKIRCLSNRGPINTKAKVIHDGTSLAEEKKGRYEFIQALAYNPTYTELIPTIQCSQDIAYKYLYGLAVENTKSGYHLVSYEGCILGFIKGSNNKYPKYLRNRFERYEFDKTGI